MRMNESVQGLAALGALVVVVVFVVAVWLDTSLSTSSHVAATGFLLFLLFMAWGFIFALTKGPDDE